MKRRSLTVVILAVLALCGLIIPHLGFAYPTNPKGKALAKKVAASKKSTVKSKKTVAPQRKNNPKNKAKASNKKNHNTKPTRNVRKSARPIKKQPVKKPANRKNKMVKDAAAAKIMVGECPICLENISLAQAYETTCCKQMICKADVDKLKDKALTEYNNMQDPVWRARHAASPDFRGWPEKVSKDAQCPFCRAESLKVIKVKSAPKVKPQKPAPVTKACPICMDDKPVKEFIQLECGHSDSCQDCALAMFDEAIQHKKVDKAKKINETLRCPHVGDERCNKPFTQHDIQAIVKNDAHRMQEYRTILDEEWIHENTNPCRTPNCNGRFAKDPGARAVKTQCPQCNKQCCSACLLPHDPLVMTCKEAQAAAEDNGDKANAAWLNKNAKPCPACNVRIEKNGGCNAVRCNNCRYEFCWVCGSAHNDTAGHVHVYLNRDGYVEPVGVDPARMADTLWFDPSRFDYHEYLRHHNFEARRFALPEDLRILLEDNVRFEEIGLGRDPSNSPYDKEFADLQLQELAKLEQFKKPKKAKKKKIIRARKVVKPKVQHKKIKKQNPYLY